MENRLRVEIFAAVLTVSDRVSSGQAQDKSGAMLVDIAAKLGWPVSLRAVVPDEKQKIAALVRLWCDRKEIPLVLITGGTGLGPRDVTPEAVKPLLKKELPGFSELMRRLGAQSTPTAILSRQVAGIRGSSLVLALPGSPRGAEESLRAVSQCIPHALAIIRGGGHEKAKK